MRKIFGFGLIVGLLTGSVFSSCKKEDEIAPYFDKSNKLLLSETTSIGDGNDYKTEYKYDKQGNVIEIRYLVGGRVTVKCKMWYNEYGDVVKEVSSDDNVLTNDNDWTIYEYDYNGNVVTITVDYNYRYTHVYVDTYADSERKQLLSHSEDSRHTTYYTYDNEGNLIKLEEYHGELIYRREITVYDENTVYFSQYYYYDYSTSIDSTHIKYVYTDSKREHIVSYEYNKDGNNRAEYTSYDSNGNISLVEVYKNGILVGKQTDYEYKNNTITYYYYRFDESGEVTSQTYYVLVYGDK